MPLPVTPTDREILARATAESLAMPALACGLRACRRHGCHFVHINTGLPYCLGRLDPGQRALWQALYDEALALLSGVLPAEAGDDALAAERSDAALEVVVAVLMHDLPRLTRILAVLNHLPAPACPPDEPVYDLAAMKAELAALGITP